jgi:hypothetical protein
VSSGLVIWGCHLVYQLVLSSGVVIRDCLLWFWGCHISHPGLLSGLSSGVSIWCFHLVLSLGCHLCCCLVLSFEMTWSIFNIFIENFILSSVSDIFLLSAYVEHQVWSRSRTSLWLRLRLHKNDAALCGSCSPTLINSIGTEMLLYAF